MLHIWVYFKRFVDSCDLFLFNETNKVSIEDTLTQKDPQNGLKSEGESERECVRVEYP